MQAAALYLPAMKTVYSQSLKKYNLTRGWSLFDGGNMIAIAGGSAIGGTVIGIYGFDGAIWTMFVLELLGAIFALNLFVKSKKSLK